MAEVMRMVHARNRDDNYPWFLISGGIMPPLNSSVKIAWKDGNIESAHWGGERFDFYSRYPEIQERKHNGMKPVAWKPMPDQGMIAGTRREVVFADPLAFGVVIDTHKKDLPY